MKWLLISPLLFMHSYASAQSFESEARVLTDRICDSTNYYAFVSRDAIFDSILFAAVSEHVISTIEKGYFTYPYEYLNQYNKEPKAPKVTNTGSMWLSEKYNIKGGLWSGCNIPHSHYIHDSLMNMKIEEKYGRDIFVKAAKEADSVDEIGLGLKLAYIGSTTETNTELLKVYEFVNELPRKHFSPDTSRYIAFDFKSGRVSSAVIYWSVPRGMMIDTWWKHISDNLTYLARFLDWTPPTFLGKPVDKLVFWNASTGKLFF